MIGVIGMQQFYDRQGRPFAPNVGYRLTQMLNGVKHALYGMSPDFADFHPGLDREVLRAVAAGKIGPTPELIKAVNDHPPLRVRDLYPAGYKDEFPVVDDTVGGVVIYTAGQRKATERDSFRGPEGDKVKFYTYADTAMSRNSLFRPEWISEHYLHDGENADNTPDWAFNKGHFEHQMTYFIGPVNFHWIGRDGQKHVRKMNTGDTNYITPFVPHTFSTRSNGKGIILAVTYGGSIATEEYQSMIQGMPLDEYVEQVRKEMPKLNGGLPTDPDGVIIHPHPGYSSLANRLIGNIPFQPKPRCLEILIGEDNRQQGDTVAAERWGYNIGRAPLTMEWESHAAELGQGDSFFIKPGVRHSFKGKGKLLIMEIMPEESDLKGELALILRYSGEKGIARIHSESTQWF